MGCKNTHGAEWEKLKADFDARLAKMTKEALKDGWLKPQAVYGYFPCQADGDDLIIYDPEIRFNLPIKTRDRTLQLPAPTLR